MMFKGLGHVESLALSLEEDISFDNNVMNLITECNTCRILKFVGESSKNLQSLEIRIQWNIPCNCGDIVNSFSTFFKRISGTLKEMYTSQSEFDYVMLKSLSKNCPNLRKCLIYLNGKQRYENEELNELAMELNKVISIY